MIDALIVAFRPDAAQLKRLLEAVLLAQSQGVPVAARVWHNDGNAPTSGELGDIYRDLAQRGLTIHVGGGEGNLGYGSAINRMVQDTQADFVLALNQDAIPEVDALAILWETVQHDGPNVAAWEMRQIPFEHPKVYSAVGLDTEWVSGAAVLLRTAAMREVGGFEQRIFMYGEDVDLSWRLRSKGYRLRYVARAAVVHHTYKYAEEVKPLQALQGIYVNLCLRARYAGHKQIFQGLSMALGEMMMPQSFPGRRMGIAHAVLKFCKNYRYFWKSHVTAVGFEPRFAGWGYEARREGAFHKFLPRAEQPAELPLISVLIRTHKRPGFLREALISVAHQTHRPIEVVVVEDGTEDGLAVCEEFKDRLTVRYFRISPGRGRSVAGNRALAEARGEWICFLDDDDAFFADHLEVLLQTTRDSGLKGAYSLAWRTTTQVIDATVPAYLETRVENMPDEAFSRVTLWHHNFMPIQSVLFHHSLYQRYGGFAEDMDQLEDWNLWTRYTMQDDFVQVRKTTSKYRVPAEVSHTAERQGKLDDAYKDAVARQGEMKFSADPVLVRQLALDYVRSNSLINVSRDQVRAHIASSPMLARLMAMRTVFRRRLGRS